MNRFCATKRPDDTMPRLILYSGMAKEAEFSSSTIPQMATNSLLTGDIWGENLAFHMGSEMEDSCVQVSFLCRFTSSGGCIVLS